MKKQTYKYNLVAKNFDSLAADITAVESGVKKVKDLPVGTVLAFNNKGEVVQAAADLTGMEKIRFVQVLEDQKTYWTPEISLSGLKGVTGVKATLFKGDRLVFDTFTGVASADVTLSSMEVLTIGLTLQETHPEYPDNAQITGGAVVKSSSIKAEVYSNLVKSLYKSDVFSKHFRAVVCSDIAAGTPIDITATKGSNQISYSGTLTKGDYIRFQYTAASDILDDRDQPIAIHRVDYVNSDDSIATLSSPWEGDSIAATEVTKVAPSDDSDDWGILIEAKPVVVRFEDGLNKLISPKFDYTAVSGADYTSFTHIGGCVPSGHYAQVQISEQESFNWLDEVSVTAVDKNKYYSSITLEFTSLESADAHTVNQHFTVQLWLEKGTEAEVFGDTATWLDNILDVNGDEAGDSTTGAVVNAVNITAIEAGVLADSQNTDPNEGGMMTDGVDI